MLIIFFDIKGIVHKEFVLAGQTVSSAYYCDVLGRLIENMPRLRPDLFGDKRTGCCVTTTHRLTLPFPLVNFFTKSNMTAAPTPLFSVPPIEDETERPPF
jgi:hypothetical protein